MRTYSGRKPSQDEYELNAMCHLFKSRGVRSYLEIGARHGDTFHHVIQSLGRHARGCAVDLPGGLWGTDKSVEALRAAVQNLNALGYQTSYLFGDSGSFHVRALVSARGPYDAVLIDGDHRYEGVKRDWEMYKDAAPLIAFHDIVGHDQAEKVHGNKVEVPRLWSEIKNSGLQTWEFIADGSKMGIGVCCP